MNRLMWPLGILLLVGSLVGAGWVLNHTAPDPSTEGKSNDHSHEPLSEVFCLGMVDVEKGVTDLYPKQPGEVAEIADAQTTDKAGLEVRDVDAPKDPRGGGLAVAAPPGESQETEELLAPLLAPVGLPIEGHEVHYLPLFDPVTKFDRHA